ncbi:type II toxin-antitoxin system VapC family toxin [Parabacteroides bouchesdurhonensis]|uniref:type II toxin-antitoxin system VapC family toxin n=1 Tax=Parabacteroides bouchesdurhonensis TaxID=1936995 RepID=UPI000E48F7F8|nr:PIN domain-containing protein [Parabacteroides bouchesdurhonensis]RHJ91444.1 PIN domain-containing protein [Bacteroides sp. AM07-16]
MKKPRLFLDNNILVDFLGERDPFCVPVEKLVSLADKNKVELYASSLSFATTFYLLARYESTEAILEKFRKFLILCSVSPVDETVVKKALASGFKDFEDAMQYYSALAVNATAIITRNAKDFKASTLPVFSAEEYLKTR